MRKAFEIAKVSKMDKNDYILYQISKSKKYDMELVEEAAEQRGIEKGIGKGIEDTQIAVVLTAHHKGFNAQQICDFTGISHERVLTILKQYAK